MRIAFFDTDLPYYLSGHDRPFGGASVRINAFSEGLTKLKHEVAVITFKGANSILSVTPSYKLIEAYNPDYGIKYFRWFFYRIPLIIKSIIKYNPEVLILRSPGWIPFVFLIISKLLGIKFIYLVTGDLETTRNLKRIISAFEYSLYKIVLRKSALVICQNTFQSANLKREFPGIKAVIIKNPYFPRSLNNTGYSDRKKDYICWVGNFRKIKGLDLLHDFATRFKHIKIKIAGMNIEDNDKLKEGIIKELGKLPNIEFVGNIKGENLMNIIGEARFLLNTSYSEGFSNTFLDAFYTGTPVISLNVNPDGIFDDHVLGLCTRGLSDTEISDYIDKTDYKQYYQISSAYLKRNHDYIQKSLELINAIL